MEHARIVPVIKDPKAQKAKNVALMNVMRFNNYCKMALVSNVPNTRDNKDKMVRNVDQITVEIGRNYSLMELVKIAEIIKEHNSREGNVVVTPVALERSFSLTVHVKNAPIIIELKIIKETAEKMFVVQGKNFFQRDLVKAVQTIKGDRKTLMPLLLLAQITSEYVQETNVQIGKRFSKMEHVNHVATMIEHKMIARTALQIGVPIGRSSLLRVRAKNAQSMKEHKRVVRNVDQINVQIFRN